MARTRSLSPQAPKDEDLAELSWPARYVFTYLPTLADREGRLEYRPRRIKAELLPYDDVDMAEVLDELLQERRVSTGSFLQLYEVGGRKYLQILKFKQHQSPHSKEGPSTIPPAPTQPGQGPSEPGLDPERPGEARNRFSSQHPDPDPDPDRDPDRDPDPEHAHPRPARESGESPGVSEPVDVATDACLELNHWLGGSYTPSEPLRQVLANLLLTGSARGGVPGEGFAPSDIRDAVRGYIVRERTDSFHEKRRREKSPVTLLWVLRDTGRFAEYSEFGRLHFDAWAKAEQARRDQAAQREEVSP